MSESSYVGGTEQEISVSHRIIKIAFKMVANLESFLESLAPASIKHTRTTSKALQYNNLDRKVYLEFNSGGTLL